MTDTEKRAHDIAVSILPHVIAEDKVAYLEYDRSGNGKFQSFDVIQTYCEIYEALLKELHDYGEF